MSPLNAANTGSTIVHSTQIESTFLNRAVKWFRGEGQGEEVKAAKKIAAVAIAFFLCLTGIGILVVIQAVKEWNRQDKAFEVESEEEEEEPPPPVVSSSMTIETIETKTEKPKPVESQARYYPAEEQKIIITKVNRALKGTLPGTYRNLEQKLAKEELEGLLDEAKVLAHFWAVKDNPGETPPADIYRTLIVANLDMLLRGYAKDQKFPNLDT